MKESNQSRIELKEIKSTTFATILDYIYFQSTEGGTEAEMFQLIECARMFQLEDLEYAVVDYLKQFIEASNCLYFANWRKILVVWNLRPRRWM